MIECLTQDCEIKFFQIVFTSFVLLALQIIHITCPYDIQRFFSNAKISLEFLFIFSIFSLKTYIVGTHKNCLSEARQFLRVYTMYVLDQK